MNGIFVINKDLGYTSRDVVNIVSKQLNTKKVGHTGTLDPMASGVLVLCVGNALKLCEMLTEHDKEYIAGITLGIETDTLDMDGKIISTEMLIYEKILLEMLLIHLKVAICKKYQSIQLLRLMERNYMNMLEIMKKWMCLRVK